MKKVLVLNGSFCEIPIIEECHRLGYYVVTTGNMPQLEGHKYADAYIKVDEDKKALNEAGFKFYRRLDNPYQLRGGALFAKVFNKYRLLPLLPEYYSVYRRQGNASK